MDRTTRRLGLALAISVGINLFVVGAATSHWLRRSEGPAPVRDGGRFLFRSTERLSEPGRAKVRSIMKRHRSDLAPRRRAMRQAQKDVQAALGAEPFDRARLDRGLEQLRKETSRAQRELHTALGEAAAQLGPEDRKHLAEAMATFRRPGGAPRRR